ncbi:hypothetical protein K438DRAFT_1862101, partial [Mycena galopus ATCC 62051]
ASLTSNCGRGRPVSPCYPPPNCRHLSVTPPLSHSHTAVGNSKLRRLPSPPAHSFDEHRPYHLLRQCLPPGACCQGLAAHASCSSSFLAALTLFPSVSSSRHVSVIPQLIHGAFHLDLLSIPCLHEASLNCTLFVIG